MNILKASYNINRAISIKSTQLCESSSNTLNECISLGMFNFTCKSTP